MSIASATSEVNRLTSDLASLRSKLAAERSRLAGSNAKAMKAVEALSRASNPTQLSSRARDVERHQRAAASFETKVAQLERSVADKQKSLSSAQDRLDRARRDQQKKEDREVERRRRADLEHLRTIERSRRATMRFPETPQSAPVFARSEPRARKSSGFNETFDVCLSFAGEQRDYVERIAAALKDAGLRVFYDQDHDIAAMLWGKDLGEVLDYVYREGSRFCLMFISSDYAEKAWTRHERQSALARAIEEDEYVLPARFDDTALPGFRPTIAYVDLREVAPATLVEFVLTKLEQAQAAAS